MFQCLVGGIAAMFVISAGSAVAEGMIFGMVHNCGNNLI